MQPIVSSIVHNNCITDDKMKDKIEIEIRICANVCACFMEGTLQSSEARYERMIKERIKNHPMTKFYDLNFD